MVKIPLNPKLNPKLNPYCWLTSIVYPHVFAQATTSSATRRRPVPMLRQLAGTPRRENMGRHQVEGGNQRTFQWEKSKELGISILTKNIWWTCDFNSANKSEISDSESSGEAAEKKTFARAEYGGDGIGFLCYGFAQKYHTNSKWV